MRLVSPSSHRTCVPLRIIDGEGAPGAWLGGRPPRGVIPPTSVSSLRYFGTVPLSIEPELCVSIFVADLEPLMGVRGRINEVGLLHPIVHPPVPRELGVSPFDSVLSEHSLMLLEPTEDWVEDDDGQQVIRPEHKIGGRPPLVREQPALLASVDDVRKKGYLLIAQFDFPSGEDAVVSGDWPFADGILTLFGREPFGERDWCWYWDF